MRPRTLRAFTLALLAIGSAATVAAQERPTSQPAWVAEAIADGLSKKDLNGYRIAKRATLIKSAIAYEIGKAFTPYLRVALAARSARDAYKPFTSADVTAEMVEPLVYLYLPPQEVSTAKNPLERFVSVENVVAFPKGEKDPGKVIRPTWIKPSEVSFQNLFGAKWSSDGMVAAFPMDVLQNASEFVAIYKTKPPMGGGQSGRELRAENVEKDWK